MDRHRSCATGPDLLLNLLTIKSTYPSALTASSSTPAGPHAVPFVSVGAVTARVNPPLCAVPVDAVAAGITSTNPWAGFPAPPCGLQLSHVLVDQSCGVGFVMPDPSLFDDLFEPSDLALTGSDGSAPNILSSGRPQFRTVHAQSLMIYYDI
jgi:hypothetical protein